MFACSAISVCVEWFKTTKRQDQMHLPSRSNFLFLIPKAGNRVLIRSDPIRLQNNFIRSDPIRNDLTWSEIRKNPIGSDRIRIRIGFGSDLHISTCNCNCKINSYSGVANWQLAKRLVGDTTGCHDKNVYSHQLVNMHYKLDIYN